MVFLKLAIKNKNKMETRIGSAIWHILGGDALTWFKNNLQMFVYTVGKGYHVE